MNGSYWSKVITIAKDEWRYWLRSKLAISVLTVGLLLTLSSVIVTAINTHQLAEARASLQHDAEHRFAEQPDRHPHRMVHYGHYAFRTPSPLSMLDPGVDSYTGNSIFLEGHRQNSAMFADHRQGTALTSLGSLSPAFIVQVLAPLLLLLIGYSSISRERESKTLTFILSQGTSFFTVLQGKGLALLSVVGLIMLPMLASGVIAVSQGESVAIVSSFFAGYAVYLLIWVLLILVLSSVFSKNSDSFTTLAFSWVLLCIVMPRIASSTAANTVPAAGKLETDFAVLAELRQLGDGHNSADPAFAKLKASLLAQYDVATIEELPVNFKGIVAGASEAKLTSVLNRFAEQRMANELAQTEVSRGFGWLSPMVAIRSFSMITANTGIEIHHRFMRETETLRFDFVQALNKLHAEKLSYQDDANRGKSLEDARKARVSAENWQVLNEFKFQGDSANTRLSRSVMATLQLLFWAFGLCVLIRIIGKRVQ
ncbi:MAG: ABC transporter permease [Psychrobium sp.]